MKTGDTQ